MQKTLVKIFFLICILFFTIPKSLMMAFWTICVVVAFTFVIVKNKTLTKKICVNQDLKKLKTYFTGLFIISLIMLTLSTLNLPDFWHISNLIYDTKFIARHYLIIIELFFPIGFGYILYKTNFLFNISNKILLITSLAVFYGNNLWYVSISVASLSLIAFRKNMKWLVLPLFFANTEQSSWVVGWVSMVILTFFGKYFIYFFKQSTKTKIFTIITVTAFVLSATYSSFYNILENDNNTMWRWQVWTNEIQSLSATFGTGVGFGSAFVTTDIWKYVNNSSMYMAPDGSMYDALFLVASHNTFLNFFYRLGIIGGLLFLLLHFQTIRICLKMYKQADGTMKKHIWWAFVNFIYQTCVIMLNPGLEMMQFALGFCVCGSFIIALILKNNENQTSIKNIQTAKCHY